MKTKYIIVGAGLASICFAEFCRLSNYDFVVFDNASRTASKVAGGMFNPIVLKRFTPIWESQAQIDLAHAFYPQIERFLSETFFHKMPIYRKFSSIEEQNDWFLACDNPGTGPFLNEVLYRGSFNMLPSELGFGEVYHSGYLDVYHFIKTYQRYLTNQGLLLNTTFEYDQLKVLRDKINYKDVSACHIIFAEGFSMHLNPYFNNLPLDGTKGELLYVKIPNLKLKSIVKSGVFIIPVGADLYKVGATYNWLDKSDLPTKVAKKELVEGLENLVDVPYEIISHHAGVRPTVKDRRPLVGSHYIHKNIHILNGLGTRGVLLGPYLASKLMQNIEKGVPLDKNIDVVRYYKKLQLINNSC